MKGPFGQRTLPYVAWFHIVITPLGTNETEVKVRTVVAKVLAGVALGHGGMTKGTIEIPPVRAEEEAVMATIAEEIERNVESGRRDH